jgi:hypothetical protein
MTQEIIEKPCSDDISKQGFRRLCGSYWRQLKGLLLGESRNQEPLVAQLVITFHARRYRGLEASFDLPLPEIHPRSAPPKNFVLEAIRVKNYMDAYPGETCLSAASKLNLHRKRISKFLIIANNLPENLITELTNCNDPKILRRMSINRLLNLVTRNRLIQSNLGHNRLHELSCNLKSNV